MKKTVVKRKKKENEFGYLSRHLIIELNSDRLKLNEYKRFKDFRAEIQIRSVLQHAWAAIEHKLQYKNSEDVPQPLRRRLFQVAAILEFADDQFSDIRRNISTLRDEYREDLRVGKSDVLVNVESLDVFLETSSFLSELRGRLEENQIVLSPRPPNAQNPLSKLNYTLIACGIETIDQLNDHIEGRSVDDWTDQFVSIAQNWASHSVDEKQVYPPRAYLGPRNLVIDDTVMLRIVALGNSSKSRRAKILRDVPFGDRLQKAVMAWSISLEKDG